MPSAFFGLEIARRALAVSQLNLQIIAHNIANAGTPGYSRQRATLATNSPLSYPSATRGGFVQQIGTGVDVKAIRRIRDEFLDEVIRHQTGAQGRNSTLQTALGEIELIVNEPGDITLRSYMDDFFAAWQDLANNPELVSTRANLFERSTSFVNEFKRIDSSLKQLAANQTTQLRLRVAEANTLIDQIADLNIQIAQVTGLGDDPNDLKDSRGVLIEQLSGIIPVNTIEQDDGSMSVLVGGLRLVELGKVEKLKMIVDPVDPNKLTIAFTNGITPNLNGGGKIGGLLEIREKVIPLMLDKLNVLATSIMNRVNYAHLKGFGLDGIKNRPFFDDYRTARMMGTKALPAGTTKDTTIDQLGFSAGIFEIMGSEVKITEADIKPGEAITLGSLFERITNAQPYVRVGLDTDATGATVIRLDLFNPPAFNTKISLFDRTTNFVGATGLNTAATEFLTTSKLYTNSADMIRVSLAVQGNLNYIAAAGDDGSGVFPGPGNNENALTIAGLQSFDLAVKNATFTDYYVSMISELGSKSKTATQLASNQAVLLEQLNIQRESVSGVSLDEEATDMITYQRIYEGAARVIQVIDSLLDTLINRTGA